MYGHPALPPQRKELSFTITLINEENDKFIFWD
jgi:hypothetical protein